MLDQAITAGDLKKGGTIIEGTSGNTGVGLAMWSAVHGYKCIFVLADKQSKERIDNLRGLWCQSCGLPQCHPRRPN